MSTSAPDRPLHSLLSHAVSPCDSTRPGSTTVSHVAAIALGTNIGDRFANIELALRLLEAPHLLDSNVGTIAVVDTSFMYETAPMYVTDQPMFINCACLVETDLPPRPLLSILKTIEKMVGRTPSVRNGPRAIDLDILTYDSETIDSRAEESRSSLDNLEGELVVPHPRMTEREFVLRPLNDMIPDFIHPVVNKSVQNLLKEVTNNQISSMKRVLPFPRYPISATRSNPSIPSSIPPVPSTLSSWTFPASDLPSSPQKVYVMATLNVTPDSFSDGSMHDSLPAAVSYATSSIAAGADIVDVGGYSTRPGAAYVSNEEEMSRVVPAIQILRSPRQEDSANSKEFLISVDTFRADVAKAAVLAGANCINDVYAFTGPEYPLTRASVEHLVSMRRLARELAVPVVLMHSRGEAGSNKDYSGYGHMADGVQGGAVLGGVQVELGDKVDAIVKGRNGVRRWFVIVDPGIGFSKTLDDNLTVLKHASTITSGSSVSGKGRNPLAGYPMLIGTSKKSFLGAILTQSDEEGGYKGRNTEPKERGWATAAAVACAVQQGATVVRVHDVPEMIDVVKVASALWRNFQPPS